MKQVLMSLILLILIIGNCIGQETVRLFLNENFEITDSINAIYIRKASISNDRYHVTDFNTKGEIMHYGEYISVNPWIEDGLTKNYIEPGVLYSQGSYDNGKITGEWLYYNTVDQTVVTVNYDLDKIDSITGDCYPDDKKLKYNRRESMEIQTIVDSFSEFFHNEFLLPARTRKNTLAFTAIISFVLENDGIIRCLNIKGFDDADLVVELQRIVSQYSYIKKSKKTLRIELELFYNERTYEKFEYTGEIADGLDFKDAFVLVEQMPTFLDKSYNTFVDYLSAKFEYPEQASKYGIQGTIFLQFIVETDGSISVVRLLRGVDPLLDAEAIRLVKSSPAWEPGKQNGEPVRVIFNLPMRINLN